MDKLFGEREFVPANAIGIMNVRNHDRIEELLQVAKSTCKIENALLVFKTTSSGKRQAYFDEVHAFMFNKKKVVETKKAFVSEISGTLFMEFEKTL